MQSVLNANLRAYRRLSGLIGFRRPIEFGLYGPRLSSGAACLSPAYGLARWEHWAGECRRCGYVGTGGHNCLRPMDRLNTRHIYLPGRSGPCAVCGRDFVRLNKHKASSAACAAAWRRLYWDNLIGDWDGVSDSLKVALVVRFGVLESPTSHVCCVCGFKGATGYSLTAHWRIQGGDSCYGILLARLEDKLFGGIDVFGD